MDLRALKYFIAVYEQGSFSAAAKACYIAQPSISSSIKQLEQELSDVLFARSRKGVVATDAGHQLYPLAKQLLGQASAIRQRFNQKSSRQPFRLGLIKGLGVERMSSLLKQFTGAVDSMELTLVPGESDADARIISRTQCRHDEQFQLMWQEQYMLAIPAQHPLSLNDTVEIADLQDLAFIQRTPCEGWEQLSILLRHQEISLDIRARITTIEYAIGLVKAGLGCAYIPISSAQSPQQDMLLKPLEGLNMSRDIGLAYVNASPIITTLKKLI